MRKRLLIGMSLLLLLIVLSQFRLVKIQNNEMAPGFQKGDWVLLGPGSASIGDVVQLQDPAEKSRTIYRRIVGVGGDSIQYRQGNLIRNDHGFRIREMHRDQHTVLRSESDSWLIRRRPQGDRSNPIQTDVRKGHIFLMADSRDESIDSRWWGSISRKKIGRKVWIRWGKSTRWRSNVAYGGTDGPWPVPKPKPPGSGAIQTGAQ